MRRLPLILFGLFLSLGMNSQDPGLDSIHAVLRNAPDDSTKVKELLLLAKQHFGSDPQKAIKLSQEARSVADSIDFGPGIALANKNIGIGHYILSDYAEALRLWQHAQSVYEEIGDKAGVSNMLSNSGAVYFNQGDPTKAIDLYLQSLKIAEEINDTVRVATALQNIGAVHSEKDRTNDDALDAYLRALPLFEALGDPDGTGLTSLNIGSIYLNKEDYESALIYYEKALQYLKSSSYHSAVLSGMGTLLANLDRVDEARVYLESGCNVAEEIGDDLELARALNALASFHEEHGDRNAALKLFHDAESFAMNVNSSNSMLRDAYDGLVRIYSDQGDFKKAFEFKTLLENVNDSIYNIEADKKLNRLLFNFEIDKKESEISLLVKDAELQEAEVKRQKAIKNGFIGGFAALLLFAGVVLYQRNRIKKGKQLSDKLLLNILPEEVAEELKAKGSAEAKLFEETTVLFTDFKSFTSVSEILTASELVEELNIYFQAFDEIITKYGIEKIKTIGDAYMAAGGIPVPLDHAVKKTIKAAAEMQEFTINRKAELLERPAFEMRVGINTGPIVAGIVGVKKFQYDIWGDTVNTAARMESAGGVGRINISQSTYDLVKDDPEFRFEPRGKIQAKGKGEMEMYFVDVVGLTVDRNLASPS